MRIFTPVRSPILRFPRGPLRFGRRVLRGAGRVAQEVPRTNFHKLSVPQVPPQPGPRSPQVEPSVHRFCTADFTGGPEGCVGSPHAAAPRRSPADHHRAPRQIPGRRLRVAAREGLPRGARLPGRRERLHRGPDRPPRRPAGPDLRGDQGPDAGDRPVGARPPARLLVLRAILRGPRVRRQLPGPRDGPRRLDAAPARRGQRARPAGAARRGGAAGPQRAGGGPRVLQPRRLQRQPGRDPDRLLDRRRRRRALHRADQGPRQRQAARRRDHRRARRGHLGPGRPGDLLHAPSTRPGGPTRSGGTGSAPRRPTTSWSSTRRTAGSGSGSGAVAPSGSW